MRLIFVLILLFVFTMPLKAQLVYNAENDSVTIVPYDTWYEVSGHYIVKLIQRSGANYSFMIKGELYLLVKLKQQLDDGSEFYDVIGGNNRFHVVDTHFAHVTHIHLDRKQKYVLLLDEEHPSKTLYMEVDTIHPDKGRFDPEYAEYE